MPEFALEMRHISKTYGTVRANDAIDVKVRAGSIHGLAGENGAGKSTLMKILFGLVEPDDSSSEILVKGRPVSFKSPLDAIKNGIGMVQQHFALAGALSALDNIILGAEPRSGPFTIDRKKAEGELIALSEGGLNLPWIAETESLSVGLQQRVEILKLLFRRADILILDEPTAVLTPQEVETFFALLRKLKEEGKTILLITHKLKEVLSLCDEVTVLRQGKVTGTFDAKNLTRDDLVRAMIGRDIQKISKTAPQPGPRLIEIRDLWVEKASRGGLHGLNLEVREREILGIAGVEGHGQTALVEALLSLTPSEGLMEYKEKPLPRSTGAIRKRLNFGLISENRHSQSLWLEASIAENCAIGFLGHFKKFGYLDQKKMEASSTSLLAPYGVRMESVRQPAETLSGGNQQKIVIAREITMRNPEFLIASHPTRGVDVGAIEFIHRQIRELRDSGAGVLLISSELDELCDLSDRIVVLYEGRAVGNFEGPHYDIKALGRAMTSGSVA